MSRGLTVSIGRKADLARITSVERVDWPQVCGWFDHRPRTVEDKADRGWYCAAEFAAPHRHSDYFVARHLLTLDFDTITPSDVDRIRDFVAGKNLNHALYTTFSHTPDKPRLRLVMPLSRPCSMDEFQAVSRAIADDIGIELAARESHVPCQMMFIPGVASDDAEWWSQLKPDGVDVDVDATLATYEDWTDRTSWPTRASHDTVAGAELSEDPRTKPGMVGKFCRAFTVEEAIERYQLPYQRTENPNRWTYTKGTRAEGGVVYDEGLKFHSHHDSDPAHGQHNAYDLVRLHKFGHLDTELDTWKPIAQRASSQAMDAFLSEDPLLLGASVNEEFEALPPLTEEEQAQVEAQVKEALPERITIALHGQLLKRCLEPTQNAIRLCGEAIDVLLYGNRLSRPVLTQNRRGFGKTPIESLELHPYNVVGLTAALARRIDFTRTSVDDGGKKKKSQFDCPPQLAAAVLTEADKLGELAVDHLTMTPILTGTQLHAKKGHDRALRAWILAPDGVQVPQNPSRADAEAALHRLEAWLGEFPFASATDRSAALAALLTAAMRASLETAPGILVSKPDYGSGASTLCDLVHVILTGRPAAVVNASLGRQETDKAIDAVQLAGLPSIVIDNVTDGEQFHSIAIAQVLSQPTRQVRVLGESTVIQAPCTQLVLVNGNNIRVADDLVRRFIMVRLDPHMENPHTREFARPDLIKEAQRDRPQLLSDLYTLTAAYRASGELAVVSRLAGFSGWLHAVAAPLVWLGLPDPAVTQQNISVDDEKRTLLKGMMGAWYEAFGQAPVTLREAVGDEFGDEEHALPPEQEKARQRLKQVLLQVCPSPRGGLDMTKLGRWMAGVNGRVIGDLSLESAGIAHGGVRRWYVRNQKDREEWLQ